MQLVLILLLFFFQQKAETEVISIQQFEELMADGNVQILDVRTPGEWEGGWIKGANKINIHDDTFLKEVSKLEKDVPLVIYCAVGGRSAMATQQLSTAGFSKIYDYKGGFREWRALNKPIEKN